MNGWQAILSEFPMLKTAWDVLSVTIPLSMLLAYSGIFFISSVAKIFSITRKRIIFDKCARQLALLGVIMGWLLLIGSRVWLYYTQETRAQGGLESFMLETSWLLLSLGVLLSTIYYTCWKLLKNMPTLHSTVGAISGTQNCLALICVLVSTRLYSYPVKPDSGAVLVPDLFPEAWNDPLWTAAAATLPLLFASAGAFGAAWLAFRRKKDDFGRDYYNKMLPWTTAWAKNAWALLWLILLFSGGFELWQIYQSPAPDNGTAIVIGCQILLWIIPCLLWIIVYKSPTPLRHRWALYLGLLLAIAYALPYFLEICAIPPADILPANTDPSL